MISETIIHKLFMSDLIHVGHCDMCFTYITYIPTVLEDTAYPTYLPDEEPEAYKVW